MNLALGKRIRTIAVAAIVGPLLQGGAAPGRYSNPDRGAEQTLAQMKTEKKLRILRALSHHCCQRRRGGTVR
jgi:hypothetical protein